MTDTTKTLVLDLLERERCACNDDLKRMRMARYATTLNPALELRERSAAAWTADIDAAERHLSDLERSLLEVFGASCVCSFDTDDGEHYEAWVIEATGWRVAFRVRDGAFTRVTSSSEMLLSTASPTQWMNWLMAQASNARAAALQEATRCGS